MNIQELILKCDRHRIFEELIKLHSDFPQEKKDEMFAKFNALIDELLAKTVITVDGVDVV